MKTVTSKQMVANKQMVGDSNKMIIEAIFEKKDVVSALTNAQMATKNNYASRCVSLVAKNGKLSILANDGSFSYCTTLESSVDYSEVVRVDRQKFLKLLKLLDGGVLELSCDSEYKVYVNSLDNKNKKIVMIGVPHTKENGEISSVQSPASDCRSFKIKTNHLGEIISKIAFLAAKEASRYALNSVLFEGNQKKLSVVATNGRVLGCFKTNLGKSMNDFSFLLPAGFVSDLGKCLQKKDISVDDDVQISFNEKTVFFQYDNKKTVASVQILKGEYTNYRDFFPNKSKMEKLVTFQKSDLLPALNTCSAVFDTSSLNRVDIVIESDKAVVSAKDKNTGEVCQSIDVNQNGGSLDIAFNCSSLISLVSKLDESFDVYIESNEDPVLLENTVKREASFQYVTMPMRKTY